MGGVSACADNAAMESFFSLLQKETLNKRRQTRQELRLEIVTWVERSCHRRRRQRDSDASPRSSSRQSIHRALTRPKIPNKTSQLDRQQSHGLCRPALGRARRADRCAERGECYRAARV